MADIPRGNRPLSPHLSVYRLPMAAVTSIMTRITGQALLAGLLLIVWWLVAAATGPRAFATADWVVRSWIGYLVLLGSAWLLGRNLIRAMLEAQIKLPDPVWARLNLAWAGFFIAMGVLNLWVAYNFTEETWVNFKMFGGMGLMLAFVLAQGFYLSRHMEEESN